MLRGIVTTSLASRNLRDTDATHWRDRLFLGNRRSTGAAFDTASTSADRSVVRAGPGAERLAFRFSENRATTP